MYGRPYALMETQSDQARLMRMYMKLFTDSEHVLTCSSLDRWEWRATPSPLQTGALPYYRTGPLEEVLGTLPSEWRSLGGNELHWRVCERMSNKDLSGRHFVVQLKQVI